MKIYLKAVKHEIVRKANQPRSVLNQIQSEEESFVIEEVIYNKGYPIEIHNVYTEDGYLLRMYRIPGGKKEPNYQSKLKNPVFLQHGVGDSADCWVYNNEENCIAFILANSGFDVWLGNSRGNKYSKFHKRFSVNTKEFWSFGFNEMGRYDLPAELDYISRVNKSGERIIFIGYAQGNTQLFSTLNFNLDYFRIRVKLFVALAPMMRISTDYKIIDLIQNQFYNFPISLVFGNQDKLINRNDLSELKEKLNDNVVQYLEVLGLNHKGYLFGNDMNWFKNDVIDLINSYSNNKSLEIELNSNHQIQLNENEEKSEIVTEENKVEQKENIIINEVIENQDTNSTNEFDLNLHDKPLREIKSNEIDENFNENIEKDCSNKTEELLAESIFIPYKSDDKPIIDDFVFIEVSNNEDNEKPICINHNLSRDIKFEGSTIYDINIENQRNLFEIDGKVINLEESHFTNRK